MVYGNIESGGRTGPFQDISSICRAAIVSGVGTNEAPFYVTFTIVEPVAAYQDPGGGQVVFEKWNLATDPVRSKPPYVSDTCCRGGWPPRLGLEANAVLKYQKMYGMEWENVRAFQIEEVQEHLCPKGMYIVSDTENGHTFVHCLPCAAGTYKDSWGTAPCKHCPAGKVSPPASVVESACEKEDTREGEEEEGEENDKDEDGGDDNDKRVTCNNKKTARASEPMSSDCAAELRNAKQNKNLDNLYARCRTALDFRKRCPQICW